MSWDHRRSDLGLSPWKLRPPRTKSSLPPLAENTAANYRTSVMHTASKQLWVVSGISWAYEMNLQSISGYLPTRPPWSSTTPSNHSKDGAKPAPLPEMQSHMLNKHPTRGSSTIRLALERVCSGTDRRPRQCVHAQPPRILMHGRDHDLNWQGRIRIMSLGMDVEGVEAHAPSASVPASKHPAVDGIRRCRRSRRRGEQLDFTGGGGKILS
jgi:hypothetical protein